MSDWRRLDCRPARWKRCLNILKWMRGAANRISGEVNRAPGYFFLLHTLALKKSPAGGSSQIRHHQHGEEEQWLQGHEAVARKQVRIGGAEDGDSKTGVSPFLEPDPS